MSRLPDSGARRRFIAAAVALATGATWWCTAAPAFAGTLSGTMYVDQNSQVVRWVAANPNDSRAAVIRTRVASQPQARWLSSFNVSTVRSQVQTYIDAANAANKVPLLAVYEIPNRDCGGASAGGAPDFTQYQTWVSTFSQGLGTKPVAIILETDSLALETCLTTQAQVDERHSNISRAIDTIKAANPAAKVYLDGGHSAWNSAATQASRLQAAGVLKADGFFTNVSNFQTTANEIAYGKQILAALGNPSNLHQIIDTSRNGNGPSTAAGNASWCDPTGRKIGQYPSFDTGEATVDGYVWVKPPGESDGCAAAAGTFLPDVAYQLAQDASDPPAEGTDTTPPTAPGAPSVSDRGPTGLVLTWAASSDPETGAAYYDIFTVTNGTRTLVQQSGTNSATLMGLAPATTYTFQIVAHNGVNLSSEPSPTADLSTVTDVVVNPPTAPGGPVASEVTETSLTLTWPEATDNGWIAQYNVYSIGEHAVPPVTTLGANSVSVTGLAPGTTYTFGVQAIDNLGNFSPISPFADVTTQGGTGVDTTPPTRPGAPTVADRGPTGLVLTWEASSDPETGAAYYDIYEIVEGMPSLVQQSGTNSATIMGLTPATTYTFLIVAHNGVNLASEPSPSADLSTVTDQVTNPPTAPGEPVASDITETSVTLTWPEASDNGWIAQYNVYSIGENAVPPVSTQGANSVSVTGLAPGTTYTFGVQAIDNLGNFSPISPFVDVTTAGGGVDNPPTAPTNVQASDVTQTTVTLTWDASEDDFGIAGYDVLRIQNGQASVVASSTTTTATVTGLNPNTQYTFAVVARDTADQRSDESAYVNVTTTGNPPGGCRVSYTASTWNNGFSTNMVITNTGNAAWSGWTLQFSFSGNQQITQNWSANWSQSGQNVTARNLDWNANIAPGQAAYIGFNGSYSGTNANPTSFTVNGQTCTIG